MTRAGGTLVGGFWRWVNTWDFGDGCTTCHMAIHESLLLGPHFLHVLLTKPEGVCEGSGAGGCWPAHVGYSLKHEPRSAAQWLRQCVLASLGRSSFLYLTCHSCGRGSRILATSGNTRVLPC